MTTKTYRKAKTGRKHVDYDQRRREVADLLNALEEWKARQHPELIAQVLAKFDGYSEQNALLIAMADPEATDVDSKKAWRLRGRVQVGDWKKDSIPIIRPADIHQVPDPSDPSKMIEVVGYYYVWHGLYDARHTVENDPEVIKAWNDAHPSGEW